jgi:hypothetical protein
MVKQDKFTKFYTFYLWTLLLILISIWVISVTTIPQQAQAQEISNEEQCKSLQEENTQLRLEIESNQTSHYIFNKIEPRLAVLKTESRPLSLLIALKSECILSKD